MAEDNGNKKVRQARAYLQNQGITTSDISPRRLVAAADELGMSFREALNYLAILLSGGQGAGPAPSVTKKVDRLKPENAIGDEPIDYASEAEE